MISSQNSLKILLSLLVLFMSACTQPQQKVSKNEKASEVESTKEQEQKTILFFGNSLTAGLGVDESETYPAEIQNRIDSLGLNYKVVNAGLSGETTAAGKNRISWVLNQPVDIFVLELGANDGLRGISLEETRKNLQSIIDTVRKVSPQAEIVLAGMQIPPNMGTEYTNDFKQIFPNLAERNNVKLIPFLLEGVAGKPELNQDDGIHPTARGYDIVAENVWRVLEPMLQ